MGILTNAAAVFRPGWLTGAILEKELRVASRRRRNYVLRVIYLLVFTLILALIWAESVSSQSRSSIYDIATMSQVGLSITTFVVWFQFIATQFITVILLSTAISDEIYNRTLGVLMTTPISSFHIVSGKLASRLLQLLVLICVTLPVLAAIRVFGGVPWSFLITSTVVTLCCVIFVGSLSLFYSIFCRRAYIVMIATFLTMAMVFLLLPSMVVLAVEVASMGHSASAEKFLTSLFTIGNPWGFLIELCDEAFSARSTRSPGFAPLWLHCAVMLSASAAILAASVAFVRRAALRQIVGDVSTAASPGTRRNGQTKPGDRISRVSGSPIVWKELHTPLFRKKRVRSIILGALAGLVLVTMYLLCWASGELHEGYVQALFMSALALFGLLFAATVPAGAISSEKESRSWLLLLTTTLGDWNILLGKVLGSLRRVLPCFGLLILHMAFFTLVGWIHPICLLQLPVIMLGIVLFMTGSGLYFSSLFRHTTTAVVVNVLLAAGLWVIFPILAMFISGIFFHYSRDSEQALLLNPLVQSVVVMEATLGENRADSQLANLSYDFPGLMAHDAIYATIWCFAVAAAYAFCGFMFAWLAKLRFRKHIF
jgi:ABC-type transport system involved in multi-copper enzyme maturation permease subunit